MQTWASVEHGFWYARSADFLQSTTMDVLRWLRVVGDTIFAAGILALGWFVLGLVTGRSLLANDEADEYETESEGVSDILETRAE
jgi:nitric oxide reductase subunit B